MTISVSQPIYHQMIGWLINNDQNRIWKWSQFNWRCYPETCLKWKRKNHKRKRNLSQGTWSEGQSRYMVWRTVKVHGLKDSILSQDPCKQRSAMDPTVTFSSSLNKVQLHETDKLTSTTSVLAYLTQTASVGMYTWITNTGLGGRPWPSHKRLSQANEISQRGSSDGSDKDKDNGTEGVICVNYT